ncbi:uncharacterized protein prr14 [Xyrauchen texanus]|uniref:uncharacterized protein prr14 n=1 Tax=Xyrauchen texanus TaxID=154827 RepID=UPI002241C58D|nr:uncharacterized protein prr14 [Xyrauchen texanus]XP_051988776.1 uncharacterized protein prr14 [Xyrauchen texanus]
MTSFGVEAVMEEQYSEGSKMVSSCATLQLGDGSPSNELNNDQKPMEQGSLESPSTIKRWEIGPLLQSFKSKMASFTEIVMSPVRLFKPSDSLSSTRFSDQQEHSTTESNEESSSRTEESETTGDKCKNRLFSKRPSSERVQCNVAPKRHRVAQRLNFGTFSGSNNKPDLYHIKLHNDIKVASNEENQIHRPSIHSQAVHQDGINDSSPCKAQSPFLRTRPIPSSDQPLNEASAKCMSCQANVQTDETVAQQRLTGERQTQSSEVDDSITACGHSSDSYYSQEVSNNLKPETNSVFANSTKTTSLNNGSEASSSIYSVFHLIGEDTRKHSVFYSEQSNSQMAIRRSPRKSVKRLSKIAEPTYTELATFLTGPKTLDNDMKELQSENVIEWTRHSVKISDQCRLKSTSVVEVRAKRCREVPRREAKKVLLARGKCNLQNTEEEDLRPAKNKKGKDNITLKKHQEDAIIVQIRKKREGISTVQQLSNTVDVHMINSVVSETSESCDSTEMKQIRPEKTVLRKRKNVKCGLLLTSGNEADTTDTTSFQNPTTNVSIDKSLCCNNLNTMYDCNYGDSRSSVPSVLQHPMQAQETFEKSVESRKTRQHFLKSARGSTFQKRNLRPPKQKFEDYSTTSVVDPAGPSKPAKRTLIQNNLFFDETQRTISTEEQKSFLSPGVLMSPPVQPDSTALLLPERRLRRPTKILNRQSKKHVFAGKRKGFIASEDQAETQEKTVEAIPVVSSSGSGSNRLLRSYSCPEIPSLLFRDSCLTLSHTHDNSTTSPKSSPIPLSTHFHSPSKRTRRHTVCSVEIEREIAPLCLRKEVYPATRGGHHSGPFSPYSPSISLTTLASCFLSSPLAFLSKSSSQWRSHASDTSTGSAHAVASPFTSNFVKSSSPSSSSSPCTSTLTACHALTGPSTVVTPRPETPSASVSSLCSAFTQSSLDGDNGMLQMECEEAMDEQERSNFGLQLSSTAISEEKALSDSEIKTEIKEGHLGKVSSIRIRKKIPKPQNNLTPMGLPKVIRIKKKDFSLEEIYTNKNFSKPPDGRLETIFEEPLNRRDGSQAIVGQRKVKRFVEFPELGVARKPKKPLVGGTAGGGAQRKAGGNHGFCRTRRGVGASSKVEDGLTLQELDSLLCSKLEELDTWTALQQVAC